MSHVRGPRCLHVQAMEFISIAQQTGDVSIDAYTRMALPGQLPPPELDGIDELVSRMSGSNPFSPEGEAFAPIASTESSSGGFSQVGVVLVCAAMAASPFMHAAALCRLQLRQNWQRAYA